MSDIRTYIDLVKGLQEAFINPYQQRPAFGRRNTQMPVHPPKNPELLAQLEKCQRYSSAEEYAKDNNPWLPVYSSDPEHVRQRAQNETDQLMAQWNHWKEAGLLGQPAPSAYR